MNLSRIFANAFARRIAYVVVALALAWLGIGQARAQSTADCSNSSVAYALCADEGSAYAALQAMKSVQLTPLRVEQGYCWHIQPAGNGYNSGLHPCSYPPGVSTASRGRTYPSGKTCQARPALSGGLAVPFDYSLPGSPVSICQDGCSYALAPGNSSVPTVVIDGQTWTMVDGFTTLGGVCSSSDIEPPPVDTDGDGVSDELDAFPNDPNETKDSDGDGIGDNADFSPDDPDDGKDDGEGDEKDNQASGGGDCKAPPTCKGDGIACNTNFQIWKLRCEKSGTVTGDPTNCTGSYTCVGDSVQCAQVALMRKNACTGATTGTPGTGTEDGPYAGTGGAFPSAGEGDDPEPADSLKTVNIGIGMLDTEGSLGGGSCPDFGSFTVMGRTIQVDPNGWWCQIIEIARMCLTVLGAFIALRVLMDR